MLSFFCLALARAAPAPLVVDGDADGISDEADDCLYTPPGIRVNKKGCPLLQDDGDADGVADEQDDCPYTPAGASVDSHGCAADGDFDGVANGLDRCPRSSLGALVNQQGCASGETPIALPARPQLSPVEPSETTATPVIAEPPIKLAPPTAPSAKPAKPRKPAPRPKPAAVAPVVAPPSAAAEQPAAKPEPPPPAPVAEPLAKPAPPVVAPLTPATAEPPPVATAPPVETKPLPVAKPAPVIREPLPQPAVSALLEALREEEEARAPGAPALLEPQFRPDEGPEPIFQSIQFAPRSVEIADASLNRLSPIGRALAQLAENSPALVVEITGHADAQEGDKPAELATQRAELVRAYLIARGVPRLRIRISADVLKGGNPAHNRRVDVRTAS